MMMFITEDFHYCERICSIDANIFTNFKQWLKLWFEAMNELIKCFQVDSLFWCIYLKSDGPSSISFFSLAVVLKNCKGNINFLKFIHIEKFFRNYKIALNVEKLDVIQCNLLRNSMIFFSIHRVFTDEFLNDAKFERKVLVYVRTLWNIMDIFEWFIIRIPEFYECKRFAKDSIDAINILYNRSHSKRPIQRNQNTAQTPKFNSISIELMRNCI